MRAKLTLTKPRRNAEEQTSLLSAIKYVTSGEPVIRGKILNVIDDKAYHVPTNLMRDNQIGVSLENFKAGEKICYVHKGAVSCLEYNFSTPYGKPVWIGCNGMPSDTQPESCKSIKIGYTSGSNSFVLDVKHCQVNK